MGYIPCPVHYTSLYLIYFILRNLYILTPYSYFAPPPRHSSWVTTSLFSVFVSSFLFCYNCSFVLFFGFHVKVKTVFVYIWLISCFLSDSFLLLNCGVGEYSLRVPWTAGRSNQSILQETGPEYSLEGLMLNWNSAVSVGHLMQRTDSFEKTLMLGKIEGRRRRGQ